MSTPSPLWFATRGAGTALMVVLTLSLCLGILTAAGSRSRLWPRFLSAGLHRNLSLFAVLLLAVHVATAVLDPFAQISWRDAVVPFTAVYRPVWLGLGVVAAEILVALVLTSMARPLLGHRPWRAIHWLSYAAWPVALFHGLGTGTDARVSWSLVVTISCVAAVLLSTAWRLSSGSARTLPLRALTGAGVGLAVIATTAWASAGPLHAGWARKAGTPESMMGGAVRSPSPAPSVAAGTAFQDPVSGSLVRSPGGEVQVLVSDVRDPNLQVVVRSSAGQGRPLLALVRNGLVTCTGQATVATAIGGTCGKDHVLLVLDTGGGDTVTGTVVIEPGAGG